MYFRCSKYQLSHAQHEIWHDIRTFQTCTVLARGVDAQVYSLYLYMLCKRHALIHVHHLSAKIHQNLPPKTDQVLGL